MDLYSQLAGLIREEGEGTPAGGTTSGALPFTRQMGLSNPTAADKKFLSSDEKDFENGVKVHMNESERKAMLARCLNENDDDGLADLKDKVATAIPERIMVAAKRLTDTYFSQAFGGARGNVTGKILLDVVVTRNNFKAAYNLIMTRIKNADRGTLEMMLSSTKDDRPLTRFAEFDDITALGSIVLRFNIDGKPCVYTGTIDTDYMVHEVLHTPEDVAMIIEDEFQNTSVSKNAVYPTGGVFKRDFAMKLKRELETHTLDGDEQEKGE